MWPSGSWHTWLWQRAPSRTLTVPALGCTWASLPELSARAGLGSGLSHQTSVCAVRLGPREPCFPVLCWCSLQDCASVSRSANWGGRGRGNEPHQPVTGEGGVGLRGWRYLPKPGLRFTVRSPPPPGSLDLSVHICGKGCFGQTLPQGSVTPDLCVRCGSKAPGLSCRAGTEVGDWRPLTVAGAVLKAVCGFLNEHFF